MNKPDLKLTIVGYFDATEPIAEPNLGLQRSVQIKNKLTQAGLSGDRINCTSEIQRLFQGADDRSGIVLLSTLLSVIIFQEKLSSINKFGVLVSVLSIILIAYSS